MRDRLIFFGITLFGLLPGLMILFGVLISRIEKGPANVIGGNTLPTFRRLTTPLRGVFSLRRSAKKNAVRLLT